MAAPKPEIITSLANESIKLARSMSDKKVRRETGLFLAVGRDMLERARAGGYRPHSLFVDVRAAGEPWANGLQAWEQGTKSRVSHVTEAVMAKLSGMSNPPPIAALLKQRHAPLPAIAGLSEPDTWLVLEDIRDPGNLGTIIRTADAAGAKGVILVGDCADVFSPEAVRASTGSIFAMPVVTATADDFALWAKDWPGFILGSAATGAVDFRGAADRHPVLLLIGSKFERPFREVDRALPHACAHPDGRQCRKSQRGHRHGAAVVRGQARISILSNSV